MALKHTSLSWTHCVHSVSKNTILTKSSMVLFKNTFALTSQGTVMENGEAFRPFRSEEDKFNLQSVLAYFVCAV